MDESSTGTYLGLDLSTQQVTRQSHRCISKIYNREDTNIYAKLKRVKVRTVNGVLMHNSNNTNNEFQSTSKREYIIYNLLSLFFRYLELLLFRFRVYVLVVYALSFGNHVEFDRSNYAT